MKHKAVRVDNLMYEGCELHWKCVNCGMIVPHHCYNKEQFEQLDCPDTKHIEIESEVTENDT
jgi:hypothetical protein